MEDLLPSSPPLDWRAGVDAATRARIRDHMTGKVRTHYPTASETRIRSAVTWLERSAFEGAESLQEYMRTFAAVIDRVEKRSADAAQAAAAVDEPLQPREKKPRRE